MAGRVGALPEVRSPPGASPRATTRETVNVKIIRTLIAALTVGLAATTYSAQAQDKGTVGIAMPTKSSLRWISDGNELVKALEAKG
jgi:hypothetical protein